MTRPGDDAHQLTIYDELETWEEWFAALPPIPARSEAERTRAERKHKRPSEPKSADRSRDVGCTRFVGGGI